MGLNSGRRSQAAGVEERRIVDRLCADIKNTIGANYEPFVVKVAAHIRQFTNNPVDFEQRVVDEVQQYLHDTFVDTSWPRCPTMGTILFARRSR